MSNHSSGSQGAESQQKSTMLTTVEDLGGEIKDLAGDAADATKKGASSQIEAGKTKAAEGIGSVASALRKTGENLRAENNDTLTGYIDSAAQKLDSASDYLKDRSLSEMASELKSFARREPALFLGGALVVGLLGGRFLKSSAPGIPAPKRTNGTSMPGSGSGAQ